MFKTQDGSLSEAAFWACKAQDSLQRNWFPDPIQVARYQQYEQENIYLSNFYIFLQGLFSYQTWNGMDGFWQNGVVLETMANAMDYLNFTRYSKFGNKRKNIRSQTLSLGLHNLGTDQVFSGPFAAWTSCCLPMDHNHPLMTWPGMAWRTTGS